MNEELFNEASRSNVLSKKLVDQLQESMSYSSISFINWTIEVLKLLKARIERGDKLTDETTGVTYDLQSFRKFVEDNFSDYITGQVFAVSFRAQKVYFSLESCPVSCWHSPCPWMISSSPTSQEAPASTPCPP